MYSSPLCRYQRSKWASFAPSCAISALSPGSSAASATSSTRSMLSEGYRLNVSGLLPIHKQNPVAVLRATDPLSRYDRMSHGETVSATITVQSAALRNLRDGGFDEAPPGNASHIGANIANGARLARVSTPAPSARPALPAIRWDPLRRVRCSSTTASAVSKVHRLVSCSAVSCTT